MQTATPRKIFHLTTTNQEWKPNQNQERMRHASPDDDDHDHDAILTFGRAELLSAPFVQIRSSHNNIFRKKTNSDDRPSIPQYIFSTDNDCRVRLPIQAALDWRQRRR